MDIYSSLGPLNMILRILPKNVFFEKKIIKMKKKIPQNINIFREKWTISSVLAHLNRN